MKAVDTKVIVRMLVGDDARQTSAATTLFASGPIWIAKTVLLETGRVLGSVYGLSDLEVREALSSFLGPENVEVEDKPSIAKALLLVGHGIEFADAMHLSSRPPGVRFLSFDKALVRRALRAGVLGIAQVTLKPL